MSKKTPAGYEVGRGRPPKHSQFRKGQSGNPKGRPKGGCNLKTEFLEEFSEQITMTESGRRIRVTKLRAMLKSLMAQGAKGDMKAMKLIFEVASAIVSAEPPANENGVPEDEAIIAAFLRRSSKGGSDE